MTTPQHEAPRLNISRPPGRRAAEAEWIDWANSMPSLHATGLTCTAIDATRARFSLRPFHNFPENVNGAANGGLLACAADQAMGITAVRGADSGAYAFTISLSTQFHRAAVGSPLELRAEYIAGGSTVGFVHVEVLDARGNLCASSQGAMRVNGGTGS